jgi:hypothetical protein
MIPFQTSQKFKLTLLNVEFKFLFTYLCDVIRMIWANNEVNS